MTPIPVAWDLKQTYQSITAYTLEVYEVVDAIDRNDLTHLSEELGDLLFQIVFYCQLAEEENQFNFDQVVSKNYLEISATPSP